MLALFDIASIAFLVALVLTPMVRNLAYRAGFVDRPDSHRKTHSSPIPHLGGVAVAFAYGLSLVFIAVAPYKNLNLDVHAGISAAMSLAPAALIILLIGVVDDVRGLQPWQKLAGETVAAILVYSAGFGVHIIRWHPLTDWVSLPVTVLWLVGSANALNLIDGMDGLAAGVAFFATTTSFVAALMHHSLALALLTAPLAGALLGFLRYNFNPASIFLGDSGSLFIGFLLGCFSAMWGEKSATAIGMTAPLIALAMPLLDAALAIVRRFLRRQPIFTADRGHIHHRLVDLGLTPRRAVLVLYGFCGLAALLSLLQDAVHKEFHGPLVVLVCGAAWIGVQQLRYAEFGITSELVLRGSFRSLVAAKLKLQQFEAALNKSRTIDETWDAIETGTRGLGLAGVRLRVGGRAFASPDVDRAGYWQVRVPIKGGQFLNLYVDPSRKIHPTILASFPGIVERFLTARFVQPELVTEDAVVDPAAIS